MHIKHFGFLIANICLSFGSSSIFAQANPISAIFGAVQQILPSTKSSEHQKVSLKTRHLNRRTNDNHLLAHVNRTAGGLVRAVLYTPIESIQMVSRPNHSISHIKATNNQRIRHTSYHTNPHVGNPVIPRDNSFRAENYTGQDIAIFGKQNNLLSLILPLFKFDTRPQYFIAHDYSRLIYTATVNKDSHKTKMHNTIKTSKYHHETDQHTKKHSTQNKHKSEKQKTGFEIKDRDIKKHMQQTMSESVSNQSSDVPKKTNSTIQPASLDKLVPPSDDYKQPIESQPVSSVYNTQNISNMTTNVPLSSDPFQLNEPGLTIPNKPSENNSPPFINTNNGVTPLPASQNTQPSIPYKPDETLPQSNKN